MNDGRAIANMILDIADSNGREVTNLSLQKIIFFCHGWCIAKLGKPLIKQDFEAWQYGPVLQHVYREFRSCDRSPIKIRAKQLDPISGNRIEIRAKLEPEIEEIVRESTRFYSRLRPGTLVEMSHAPDGPWDKVWNHSGTINPGMRMSNEDIGKYFSSLRAPF
ncbi:DUF4065 domain-containing protein [Luteimonas sp. S4-F44]|uniref:Panacea domain-containing protein n=1 Tax=Luteimonas sp. S4-F44 TaxID=2925842 RepID=UPI001F52CCA6|nr:type II toxin-antitoxin system antitoxin SocA domain-containing protein [Luteimonas sp. S4-F44]UNK42138.1 DUF4065 domain-containing protein [Luteimonas sp. S4-F44]